MIYATSWAFWGQLVLARFWRFSEVPDYPGGFLRVRTKISVVGAHNSMKCKYLVRKLREASWGFVRGSDLDFGGWLGIKSSGLIGHLRYRRNDHWQEFMWNFRFVLNLWEALGAHLQLGWASSRFVKPAWNSSIMQENCRAGRNWASVCRILPRIISKDKTSPLRIWESSPGLQQSVCIALRWGKWLLNTEFK